eukprot:TRINITY_DN29500_c1_g1_i2.p1 TRINITY_DN29500_c1_g1~~TRINITY_DN29500_c1_g1_i2.p1  ORF type:complete len:275 (-),score=16.01 TRINITY_DN29500_c1_g1_i2:225-1016(-)
MLACQKSPNKLIGIIHKPSLQNNLFCLSENKIHYQFFPKRNLIKSCHVRTLAQKQDKHDQNRRSCLGFLGVAGLTQIVLNEPSRADSLSQELTEVRTFDGDGFVMQIPADMDLLIASNINGEPNSPLRAQLEMPNDLGNIVVVTKDAFKLKQVLFQVQDISELGNPTSVAQLVLPPGIKMEKITVKTIKREAIDTLLGPVDQKPQNVYRYAFVNPQGKHFLSAVAAAKGLVFVLAATGNEEKWDEVQKLMSIPVNSFRLLLQT